MPRKQFDDITEEVEVKDDFVCETEVENDKEGSHYLHNPKTGIWKKSKVCVK